jgi:hypothetical protein
VAVKEVCPEGLQLLLEYWHELEHEKLKEDEMKHIAADENIREVVEAIASLPGIETFSSCGGHKVCTSMSQRPEGSFYVSFAVAPTKAGFRSLARITFAADCNEAEVSAWYNGPEEFDAESLCFEIRGSSETDRKALADCIKES